MANPGKRKGKRVERLIKQLHEKEGIPCELMPLSGQLGGSLSGDVYVAKRWKGEVKARANGEGFATLEGWLGKNQLLFLKRDRSDPFVAMPWSSYVELVLAWNNALEAEMNSQGGDNGND